MKTETFAKFSDHGPAAGLGTGQGDIHHPSRRYPLGRRPVRLPTEAEQTGSVEDDLGPVKGIGLCCLAGAAMWIMIAAVLWAAAS